MAFRVVNANMIWVVAFMLGLVIIAVAFGQIFDLGAWSKDLIGSGIGSSPGDTLSAVGGNILGGG